MNDTHNAFSALILAWRQRFTLSAHAIVAPAGGLTGLMERPDRLDWFAVKLTYTDSAAWTQTMSVIIYQSKVRRGKTPVLAQVLTLLMADLMTHLTYDTFEAYWTAMPCFNRRQAEAAYNVTVQRGLALADLLGVDLQAFVQAYDDELAVLTPPTTALVIGERV